MRAGERKIFLWCGRSVGNRPLTQWKAQRTALSFDAPNSRCSDFESRASQRLTRRRSLRSFQPLGHVQFDRSVTRLVVLDRRSEMDAEPLGGIVRHDHPVIELQRLVENGPEKIRVQPEIDNYLIGRLRDPANVRVGRLHIRGVDLWSSGCGRVAHGQKSGISAGAPPVS